MCQSVQIPPEFKRGHLIPGLEIQMVMNSMAGLETKLGS